MEEDRLRQSLPVNLLLSLVVIGFFLAVAEGVARRFERPPRPRLPENYTLDWEMGWGRDFYILRFPSTGWPRSEAFNRDGVRDRFHPLEKPEGVRRVVCLGDSVTLGYPGPPEQAYPRVLESRLEALGPGVEIFNVALMAWSTRQERIAYERIARKYRPDQVVLGICLNDLQELQNNLARPSRLLTGLYRRSALARWVVNAEGREIDSVQQLFVAPHSLAVRAGMGRFFQELRRLRDEVRADGVDFSAVLFPYAGQVEDHPPPPIAQDEILNFCAREGIRVLDLLPTLRELGPKAFTPGDPIHPTAEGYARVADAMIGARLVPEESYSISALREALAGRSPDAPVLVALLDSPHSDVRRQAAWLLGRIGRPAASAVPGLARRLKDGHESVRAAGGAGPARGAGRFSPRRALERRQRAFPDRCALARLATSRRRPRAPRRARARVRRLVARRDGRGGASRGARPRRRRGGPRSRRARSRGHGAREDRCRRARGHRCVGAGPGRPALGVPLAGRARSGEDPCRRGGRGGEPGDGSCPRRRRKGPSRGGACPRPDRSGCGARRSDTCRRPPRP